MKRRRLKPGIRIKEHRLDWVTENHIRYVVVRLCGGNLSTAATVLGIDRKTISRHLGRGK